MPHLKVHREKEPLWKAWDYAAQKRGIRHTIYSVNGDQYTGEWLDNKKHGTESLSISLSLSGRVLFIVKLL